MTMYERIKDLCKKQDITVSQLEAKAGLKPRTMTRWDENDPSWKKVAAVADILHTSMDYLTTGKENAPVENEGKERLSDLDPDTARAIQIVKTSPAIRSAALALDKLSKEDLADFARVILDVTLRMGNEQ